MVSIKSQYNIKQHLSIISNVSKGFTLIELMIVIAILAILVTLALPSMRQFVVRSQVANIANDLVGSINFARSEAIRRGQPVTMCPRASATSGNCGTSQFWTTGWIVCADVNANNRCVTPTTPSATTDEILRVRDRVAGNFSVVKDPTNTSAPRFIRFNSDGTLSSLGVARFNIESPDSNDIELERTICVARTGRARVVDYAGANTNCS